MIRLLLATTAVAAVLASGAIAQDASSSSSMMDSSAMDSSSMDSSMMESSAMSSQMSDASSMESSMMEQAPVDNGTTVTPRTPVDILSGYTRVDSDLLATNVIGKPVYDGTATDANNLGNINNLVLNQNGEIAAVIIGVGGFLGLGEKQVAVDYKALQWTVAADNTERFVLQTTKDDLTNAPDFQTVDDQPGEHPPAGDSSAMMSTDTMSSSSVAQ